MLYVIQVRTGDEHETLAHFDANIITPGEEAFVPIYDRKKKFRGEELVVTSVLFPRVCVFQDR